MAGKLPFMKFYPADYLQDTRALSPEAKGVWMDLICFMWSNKDRGIVENKVDALSRLCGVSDVEMEGILEEYEINHICDVLRQESGVVRLMSRRMIRENETRDKDRERKRLEREGQQKRRADRRKKGEVSGACPADVRRMSVKCPADVRVLSAVEARSQSIREREAREGVQFDEAHRILLTSDQMQTLTYEQDLTARRFGSEKNWPAAAADAVEDLVLWKDNLDNPALWWRRFLEKRSEKEVRSQTKGRGYVKDVPPEATAVRRPPKLEEVGL